LDEKKKRDIDLTIWAFIAFFGAIAELILSISLLSGVAYAQASSTIFQFISDNFNTSALPYWPPTALSFTIAGIFTLLFGILLVIEGYGLWKVKPWARILAILIGFILLPMGGLGIIILWFFWRKHTKEMFGEI